MAAPRIISITPTSGNATITNTVIIIGKDIDASATVNVIPYPGGPALAAAVAGFQDFTNGIQHLTITMPVIPMPAAPPGIPKGASAAGTVRKVSIEVTNPPYGEKGLKPIAYEARFVTPTSIATGEVDTDIRYDGGVIKQTYAYTADGSGDAIVRTGLCGTIERLVVTTGVGGSAGWSIAFDNIDTGLDVLAGAGSGVGPTSGNSAEVTITPIVACDSHAFTVSGAGANATGTVTVYLTR